MVFYFNISDIDIIFSAGLYLMSCCRMTEGNAEDTINWMCTTVYGYRSGWVSSCGHTLRACVELARLLSEWADVSWQAHTLPACLSLWFFTVIPRQGHPVSVPPIEWLLLPVYKVLVDTMARLEFTILNAASFFKCVLGSCKVVSLGEHWEGLLGSISLLCMKSFT